MAESTVVVDPQNPSTVDEPKTPVVLQEGEVAIKKEDFEDLTHKAEVSSQNFERLKKSNERIDDLEAEIAVLKSGSGEYKDERVGDLQAEIAEIKAKQQKVEVQEAFPQLKEIWSDFEKFREDPENAGMNMRTAAKAFVAEKDLTPNRRPGLEKPTGGDRAPITTGGMSSEEAKRLRETDYRKYSEMLRKGQIKVS